MKNLFKLFIFVLLGLALVACDTNNTDTKDDSGKDPATDTVETEPTPEAVQLSKPVVTVDETGLATWEAVENAVSYAFKVNDGAEVVTSVRNYRLTEGDSIVVKAKGNGVTFVDSEYSDAVTYSKGTDEPTQGQNPEPDPNPTEPAKFVYVLEYADTYGEEVEFTYDADADTYSITVEDLTGVVGVEFYYDGDTQISSENTTISGVGTDATSAFYQTSDNKTSFLVGNATIDDATFVYSATNNTLTITYNLINVDVTNVLEYQKYANATIEETGEAVVGDGGKYYVTLEAVSFAKFTLEWNGVAITPDNTEITGTLIEPDIEGIREKIEKEGYTPTIEEEADIEEYNRIHDRKITILEKEA